MLVRVLCNRGVETKEKIETYLTKSIKNIHNPMLFKDMDKAAARIAQAIENKEKIAIFGDYDVDGVTSTVILYEFLRSQGVFVSYHIPERESEGYGINAVIVNKLAKNGYKLLISVDCGITAVGEVELAKLLGMDAIITDHHTCQEKIPEAVAVINPKLPDSEYPYKDLAGVGVTLKLVLACCMHLGLNTTEYFNKFVSLAALGTIADVVPITDENRVIVSRGVKSLNTNPSLPLEALTRVAVAGNTPLTARSISFSLAPRINAAGRMGNANSAAEFLMCNNIERAAELASRLDRFNCERKEIETQIYEEAKEMFKSQPNYRDKRVIIVAAENWNTGVIGIVASRLCDRFYKPAIVISIDENGVGKGSGRSIEEINIFDGLTQCSDLLVQFGGHSAAAGISIQKENIPELEQRLERYIGDRLPGQPANRRLHIDAKVEPSIITMDLVNQISLMEPFGEGNYEPVFEMDSVEVISAYAIGNEGKHLKMEIYKDGYTFQCIGFSMGERADEAKSGINIVFRPEINDFRGEKNLQLKLIDYGV